VDVTQVQIPKPAPRDLDRLYWEGKDRNHAIKFEVVCSITDPRIIHVSIANPGSIHDITIARNGLLHKMIIGEQVLADKGYIGPEPQFLTPHHHPGHVLDDEERNQNQIFNRHRAKIEQINTRFKDFRCLKEIWRHGYDFCDETFHAIAKIINEMLPYHPISRN
jgi:hypothetical protein